ncbi:hypothetical protein KSP39_PZI016427 [Platanthera zijinensis]|uniref:Erythronate-4-phosphate dehydrogenase family protein n=1 Tax=Platanthera zijinensis TaxID=2320716 RepID=A0AAP0G0A5_9ASPA
MPTMNSRAVADEKANSKPPRSLYRPNGGRTAVPPPSSWLEIRLFYVRIVSCCAPEAVPHRLILSHLRRETGVTLDINGSRIPSSEPTSLALRRDRLDCSAMEVTYLSTDDVRLTGAVEFEVCDGDGNFILCGSLERMEAPWINGTIGFEGYHKSCDQDPKTGWSMSCFSAASSVFLQPKPGISSPSMEVYVAGRFAGSPLILTQTIELSQRKKVTSPAALKSILEDEEPSWTPKICTEENEGIHEYSQEMNVVGNGYRPEVWYSEGDDQLSWFNAGVRVGVGIGLGMSVGIGIGVGLLIRSYQATARRFRRRFF